MRDTVSVVMGVIFGVEATLFGPWDQTMTVLLVVMSLDYISGVLISLLGKSQKTKGGGFDSHVGWQGLVKKLATLLIVAVSWQISLIVGVDGLRTAVCVGFITNECFSLLENAAQLGVPIHKKLYKMLEIVNNKYEGQDD